MVYHLVLLPSPPFPCLSVSFHGGVNSLRGAEGPTSILLTLPLTRLCLPHQNISHQIWGSGSGGAGSRWWARGQAAQGDGQAVSRSQSWDPQSLHLQSLPPPQFFFPHSFSSPLFFQLLPLLFANDVSSVFPQPQTVPLSIPSPFPTFRSLLNQTLPRHHHHQNRTLGFLWVGFFFFALCHRTLSIFHISSSTWSRKQAS